MYNTINSLVSQAIEPTDNFSPQSRHGFSDAQIADFVQANINNPQVISNAAQQYGISPAEISRATGYSIQQIGDYFANAGINFGSTPAQAMAQSVSAPITQGVSNQQIVDYLNANPNITGKQLESVMQQYGVSPSQIASALSENAQQGGYQTQTLVNPESGQINIDARNLGAGFNAYQDENGQTSGFSRVDPSRLGMIQLYGPNGEYRGEEKITSTTQDLIKNLGPIALAAGGSALAQGLLGGTSLADIGANNVFEAANAGSSAMTDLGASQLTNAGASALTPTVADALTTSQIAAPATALGGAETVATQTIANTGMTLGQLAQLDVALGGAGGTAGALEMAATIGGPVAATAAATVANAIGGTTPLANIGANTAFEAANAGASALTDLGASELANAGAGALTPTAAANTLGATELGAGALGTTAATTGTGLTAGGTGLGAGTGLTTGAGLGTNAALGTALGTDTALASGLGAGSALGTGLTSGSLSGLTAGTAGLGAEGLGAGLAAGAGGLAAGNSLLGGSALGSTLGSTMTGALGATTGSALGAAAGSTLGSGLGSALGTTLGQGLGLNALGNVGATIANQQGISQARDLINKYGTQAQTNLADAYRNAQGLNAANRTDLGNLYANTSGNLQNLYNQQVGYQQPYQDIGRAGSQGLLANQGYLTHQFDVNDLNTNLAPNYAFMLGQGQMANQRAANAGGGALGGNALQGLQKYTQDYAGNAYQQAFNNYNTQRNNIYNSLAGMAGIGQTSTGQLANLGNAYGSNMAGLSSNYGGNLVSNAGQGIGAANAYGLNTANLATGIGSALASNATQQGANNASLLSNLGNTALLGSMIKAT